MDELNLVNDVSKSFFIFDYIKNSFPVSFIGLFLATCGFILGHIVAIKYYRFLEDQIKNFK